MVIPNAEFTVRADRLFACTGNPCVVGRSTAYLFQTFEYKSPRFMAKRAASRSP